MPYKDASVRKAYHKLQSRKHYEANKEEVRLKTKTTKAKEKKEWFAYKASLKCTNCGFSHVAALDFHHEDPSTKEGNVHKFIADGRFAKAYEEVKKCIVLCANCHRIHHHEERVQKKMKLKGIKKKKKSYP